MDRCSFRLARLGRRDCCSATIFKRPKFDEKARYVSYLVTGVPGDSLEISSSDRLVQALSAAHRRDVLMVCAFLVIFLLALAALINSLGHGKQAMSANLEGTTGQSSVVAENGNNTSLPSPKCGAKWKQWRNHCYRVRSCYILRTCGC